MLELFDRTHSGDTILDRIQDKIMRVLNPALRVPILNGHLVENVFVSYAAATRIEHKLGRKPRGWFVVRPCVPSQASAHPLDDIEADDKFLYLRANSTTTGFLGHLWVF